MMKKIYFLLAFCFGLFANAQIVNIPDANFKAKLLLTGIDNNIDGQIQFSEALQLTTLNVSSSNISDLTGIEAFINLELLDCTSNLLTSLNLAGLVNLQSLYCSSNLLSSINLTGLTSLEMLHCNSNQFSTLDISGFGLVNLNQISFQYNYQLSSLNTSGLQNLQQLNCSYCQLSSLNLTGNVNLNNLDCSNNHLTILNLVGLSSLEILDCYNNSLASLNLIGLGLDSLENLNCSNNQLTSLNVDGLTTLKTIHCGFNQLSSLNFSNLPNLWVLSCESNFLTSLDVNNLTGLLELGCNNNQLITLFIKNGINTWVGGCDFSNNPNLQYICTDEGEQFTVQNIINNFGMSNISLNSYCSFTPGGTSYTIQGSNRFDDDNNGCDVLDLVYPNMRYSITNSSLLGTFISNNSGSYSMPVQSGTYTVTPQLENPTYFAITPTSSSVTFPATPSPFAQDFCITPNGTHNDLEVVVLPLSPARPGFDAIYNIIYKNKGTHSQSGTVSLDFYDPIMDLVSTSPSISSQATNTLNWSFTNLLPFETRTILVVFNLNSPTETPALNAGNGLIYTATIAGLTDETLENNTSVLNQIVVNSFDPNDKTCTEGPLLATYNVGSYLNYIIRFENNGTANAQNIVVKDIIDTAKFDISTLIPIDGSHEFYTRIANTNRVEFIFENINLPFDDANNDGYVSFKIKTKSTLVDGDVLNNSANIYFDYNFPIVTNTYSTIVFEPLANPDFKFSSYISLSPVPTKDVLNIQTKNDITISSLSIYNTLGQLVQVITKPANTVDVSNLKTGTYFIKVISDKGSSVEKFIKQ